MGPAHAITMCGPHHIQEIREGAASSVLDRDQQTGAGRRQRGGEPLIGFHGFQQLPHRNGLRVTVGGIQHATGGGGRIEGEHVGEHDRGMRLQ